MEVKIGMQGKESFHYNLDNLKKHFIALGGSGSGKTVLCKVMIEEACLQGIPSILVDNQGDLSSLILKDKGKLKDKKVVIYTPTSSKGIPICINPLKLPKKSAKLDKEDLISVLHQISNSICKLLNYDLDNSKGKSSQALLYLTLSYAYNNNIKIKTFDKLSALISNPPDSVKLDASKFLNVAEELSKNIKFLTIGQKELMFSFGIPLDIGEMFKNDISVLYLNTLDSEEDKHFFLSMLATELYQWMLLHPSKDLQGIFFIDEISEYIPAGSEKPITKPILKLLFKQARKYGIGCIISTQNPGDIDYKAFAQFGTWAIGRLTTKQDRAKIKKTVQSLTQNSDELMSSLPKLQPGQFLMLAPDLYDDVMKFKCRWLYTEHKTLTESEVKKEVDPFREDFDYKNLKIDKKIEKVKSEKKEFIPLKIKEEDILQISNKNRKKKYFLFGEEEEIRSYSLKLRPIFKIVVQYKKGFFVKSKYEQVLYFDGVNGDLLNLNKDYSILCNSSKIIDLGENELKILSCINNRRNTLKCISEDVNLGMNTIKKKINVLLERELITEGKKFKSNICKRNFSKVHEIELTDEMIDVKKDKLEITEKQIENVVKQFLEVKVDSSEVIYFPYYEVKFIDGINRVVEFSGVTGNKFDF